MNALVRLPYELAWRAANAIAPLVPPSNNKVVRALKSRVHLVEKIDAWAGAHRDVSRSLLWMHASSVGESLQALPVMNLFRERHPELQIVFTFYSPSAELGARKFPADFVSYLPFDTASAMRHVIASIRPSVLVFSKLDVWPMLVNEANAAGIPTALISGTLHSNSGRRSGLASLLFHDAFKTLDSVGAISEQDKANIIALGAQASRVAVTGDTRFDQVWARRENGGPIELLNHLQSNRPTIVAGSTWKSDEDRLLRAFVETRQNHRRARLIIAPHEPTPPSVAAIKSWSDAHSMSFSKLDDPQSAAADVIVVDRVGVLGDLYALADIAYVGGGFHRAGLHSVLEPAAFAKPVIFGKPFGRSREAQLLVTNSAARSVSTASEMYAVFSEWLSNSTLRTSAGQAAEQVIKGGRGAAEASYTLVKDLIATATS